MNIIVKNGFPFEFLPNVVKSYRVLSPMEMFNVLEDSNNIKGHYVFFDIIMRRLNFPFAPCVYGNRVRILFYKNRHKCYITEELREPDLSQSNIKLIQHMLESKYNIHTYNSIIYTIFSKVFRLNTNNFAIYGKDHKGNCGYLSFNNDKLSMFHEIV